MDSPSVGRGPLGQPDILGVPSPPNTRSIEEEALPGQSAEHGCQVRQTRAQTLTLSLLGCVTLDQLLNLSVFI